MATTHKVVWSISATPIAQNAGDDGGTMSHDTLHENIRRTLGGSGEISYDGAIDYGGVTDGATNYINAPTTGGVNIGNSDTRFIWIRHTGYLFDTATTLGDATAADLGIFYDSASNHIATLQPGEAWFIPLPNTSTTATLFKAYGGGIDIAIELVGLD